MKPRPHALFPFACRAVQLLAAGLVILGSGLHAQPKPVGLTGKLYVASAEGASQINRGEKLETMQPKAAYNAEGAIIETKPGGTNALVFSNGTGLYLDADTRLEVTRFEQAPFTPNRSDLEVEPSVSHTEVKLSRGSISLCVNKLVAGSTMKYATSLGSATILGGQIVMEVEAGMTRISLLEGEALVRGGELDLGGQVLHAGEQALIRPGAERKPNPVTIQKIPAAEQNALGDKVYIACAARRTVFFESRDRGNGPEIIPVPVVPSSLPVPVTISPSRLPQ